MTSVNSESGKCAPFPRNAPLYGLSFFSGALGLDQGLERAGIIMRLACEYDKSARATIKAYNPSMPIVDDINDISADAVLRKAGLSANEVFIIAGGPPCQSFSTAGKRQSFRDSRGNAFLAYIDICLEIHPMYILIENVRGLLSAALTPRSKRDRDRGYPELERDEREGSALWLILEMLEAKKYAVTFELYNAANFGVPQKRERVILVACRDGTPVPYLVPTHAERGVSGGLPAWRTFRDAVDAEPPLSESDVEAVSFPEKRLKYYRMLGPGQNWRYLPQSMHCEALGGAYNSGGGKTGFLRRISWIDPSPTLVTHPAMPATDLAHPELNRPLSVQEYMRLQQFPDNFPLCGNTLAKYRQLGNAVPTDLGYAAGLAILRHAGRISSEVTATPAGFRFSRYKNTDDKSWRRRIAAGLNIVQGSRERNFITSWLSKKRSVADTNNIDTAEKSKKKVK